MNHSRLALFLGILLSTAACGDDTGGVGGAGGSGSGGGSTTSATSSTGTGGAASLCDAVAPSPNTITETQMTAAYPTPAGGTITDGVYYLSRFEIYPDGTAGGNTRANRIDILGNELRSTNVTDGAAPVVLGAAFVANGSELSLSVSCPSTQSATVPFTATATELWIFDPSEPNIQVYTKQ
jgi:hypothetical protein